MSEACQRGGELSGTLRQGARDLARREGPGFGWAHSHQATPNLVNAANPSPRWRAPCGGPAAPPERPCPAAPRCAAKSQRSGGQVKRVERGCFWAGAGAAADTPARPCRAAYSTGPPPGTHRRGAAVHKAVADPKLQPLDGTLHLQSSGTLHLSPTEHHSARCDRRPAGHAQSAPHFQRHSHETQSPHAAVDAPPGC